MVGATQDELQSIRKLDPEMLFLIPGVGQQGGSYEIALQNGVNRDGLALINIGRSIIYANSTPQFAEYIRKAILSQVN